MSRLPACLLGGEAQDDAVITDGRGGTALALDLARFALL